MIVYVVWSVLRVRDKFETDRKGREFTMALEALFDARKAPDVMR